MAASPALRGGGGASGAAGVAGRASAPGEWRRVQRRVGGRASGAERAAARPARLDVRKTYKLFIGGAFPRSESGRSYPVTGPGGALLALRGAGVAQGR